MNGPTLNIEGKHVTIVGLGRTAAALAKLLLVNGAKPIVTESREEGDLGALPGLLRAHGIPCECGGHTSAAFEKADIVAPSPGVPPAIPPIVQAGRDGAEIMGEMEIASHYIDGPMIAVTGTNGKTTTTALLHALIERCGHRSVLAGNNDLPLSEAALIDPAPDYTVVEVSSYQLETCRTFHPWIAAVLNVSNDHLARHGTIEHYADVKARVFANQVESDIAVLNMDDARCAAMQENIQARTVRFSQESSLTDGMGINGDYIVWGGEPVAALADSSLPGRHNRENVLAALSIMHAGEFDWPGVIDGLRSFRGVEHRIEFVSTIGGVEFYNDSKATNLESLRVALESFDDPVILLVGGRGKGSDYSALASLVRAKVKFLVTFGEDAENIEAAYAGTTSTHRVSTLIEAAEAAMHHAQSGDTILLSPACASFDQFKNFEERGHAFKAWVAQQAEAVST
jgi:UDP-N-acetylmuramoylalanine--D-glutamate ligase